MAKRSDRATADRRTGRESSIRADGANFTKSIKSTSRSGSAGTARGCGEDDRRGDESGLGELRSNGGGLVCLSHGFKRQGSVSDATDGSGSGSGGSGRKPSELASSDRRVLARRSRLVSDGTLGSVSSDGERRQAGRDAARRAEYSATAVELARIGDTARRDLVLTSGLGASVIGLVRTIEDEILPRLKDALDSVSGGGSPTLLPTIEQVTELARLAIARDEAACQVYVDGLLEQGMTLETVYKNLLVPAARRLGEFWLEDYCDFSDVTVGVIRLQRIQRSLSSEFRRVGSSRAATAVSKLAGRRALIVPMPCEHHTFGATLIQDFFARAGWDVSGWPMASDTELVNTVRHETFDMVGITVSCDNRLQDLSALITLVRRASRNKSMVVAVGGPPFLADPVRAAAVGADATGSTGPEAVSAVDAAMTRLFEQSGPTR
jgi:methanogenic corrinoid protein MtbC1